MTIKINEEQIDFRDLEDIGTKKFVRIIDEEENDTYHPLYYVQAILSRDAAKQAGNFGKNLDIALADKMEQHIVLLIRIDDWSEPQWYAGKTKAQEFDVEISLKKK